MKKTPCCYIFVWGRCNCFVYYSTDFAEIVYSKILILYTFDFLTQALLLPEVREERRYRYAELPHAAVYYYVAGYFDYYAVCFLVYGYTVGLTSGLCIPA